MKKDKLKLYFIELLLFSCFLITIIVSNKMTYTTSAIILTVSMLIVKSLLKKKNTKSLYQKQVFYLMFGFAIIYLALFFFIGILKNDFLCQPVTFEFKTLYRFIIPISISIITSEIMRSILLSQEGTIRIKNFQGDISKVLTFVNMVLIDVLIYIGVYDLTSYEQFSAALGIVIFASISCNLFYNYTSKRYGMFGIIVYRMITILYTYIIPITPNIHIYLKSFFRMVYPYFLYLILEKTFSKTDFVVSYTTRRRNFIEITAIVITMTFITMLVSCEFKYGLLVVGSKSMTGTINMGDAIIFEQYKKQPIRNGQIIIFKSDGLQYVHRVIDIKDINGEIRYYTKGDANEKEDKGYITKKDIVGLTKLRIVGIGWPSLWFRDLFKK
ncbi:MAG: signal peptidase I [Mycoplasmatota bacterium]|nr:signal peptidase I [Mycoplasmatota bacterium]